MADQRASDADRDRAVEQLRRAGGDGRLTLEELDERLEQAHGAATHRALAELLADLSGGAGRAEAGAVHGSTVTVRPGDGGSRWVVSVMSGARRKGRWRLAPRCVVVNVMGSSDLDLNDVELADEVTEMTVFSFMGGADIRVPEDLRVELSDIAFMGGNDVERGAPASEGADGPLLRLRMISIMGGTKVRRGRRRSRAERRAHRDGLQPPPPPTGLRP